MPCGGEGCPVGEGEGTARGAQARGSAPTGSRKHQGQWARTGQGGGRGTKGQKGGRGPEAVTVSPTRRNEGGLGPRPPPCPQRLEGQQASHTWLLNEWVGGQAVGRKHGMRVRCPVHLNEDDSTASPHLAPGAAPEGYGVNSWNPLTAAPGGATVTLTLPVRDMSQRGSA